MHESVVILAVAIVFSLIFKNWFKKPMTEFIEPEAIFTYLTPPIIFAAGFNLRRRYFFKNIGFISLYGFIGTLFSFLLICVTFYIVNQAIMNTMGTLVDGYDWGIINILKICATLVASDSIAPLTLIEEDQYPALFSIVFGEGILNDAVGLILVNTVLQIDNSGRGKFIVY